LSSVLFATYECHNDGDNNENLSAIVTARHGGGILYAAAVWSRHSFANWYV